MQTRKVIAVATLTLALGGCGSAEPAHSPSQTTPAEAPPTAQAAPQGQPWAGKVPWLSTLPAPGTIDRADAMAVARAYTVTKYSWDSTIDRTADYAIKRAGIYGTEELKRSLEPMDPDMAKGQALISNEKPYGTWTTATVTFSGREGQAEQPGTDVIAIGWRMDLHRREGGSRPDITGTDDVKLLRSADGGWRVDGSITREPQA